MNILMNGFNMLLQAVLILKRDYLLISSTCSTHFFLKKKHSKISSRFMNILSHANYFCEILASKS